MDSRNDIDPLDDAEYGRREIEIPWLGLFEELKPQLARADRQLRRIVRRNPFASLAVVSVAGFLLGRLLRSK